MAEVLSNPSLAESLAAAALARARVLPSQADAVDAAIAGYARMAAPADRATA